MGVLAARTVKAALVAAIAIVALVISLLPGLAEESGSLALTVSTCAARSRTVNCCNEGGPRAPSEARGIKAGASCVSGDGVPVLDQATNLGRREPFPNYSRDFQNKSCRRQLATGG